MFTHTRSEELHELALRLAPGGVNSPVRAFKSVGGHPLFMERGEGPYLFDVDGNKYIDHVLSWGPLLFGHAPSKIVRAVCDAAARGTTFGACTEAEVIFADKLIAAVPSLEKVRLVNSGTEAVMSAVRAARGFTGKSKIIKFEGCYHGHSDSFLSKAGSGLTTLGLPDSAGVPPSVALDTITVPFNDPDALREAIQANRRELAAILLEPVPANMGVILPQANFLEDVRELATKEQALLIFDEVITGFRLGSGGAQAYYNVAPDLTTLGKIVGGGLPLAAFGGRAEVMDMIAPAGPVYQAGTLSGNPVAVAAGLAQLEMIEEVGPTLYNKLETELQQMALAAQEAAQAARIPIQINQIGSMMTLFFQEGPVTNFTSAKRSHTDRYAHFFRHLLESGVYIAPSQYEAFFLSSAHGSDVVKESTAAIEEALRRLA